MFGTTITASLLSSLQIFFTTLVGKSLSPYCRPWYDMWAIAHTCAITCTNQEKGGFGGQWKASLKVKLPSWYRLHKILNSLPRINFNWFNRIHFKWFFQTYFLSLYFLRQILTAAKFYYLIYSQSVKSVNVLSKKKKTDIFNKYAFDNRKLIIIISSEKCNL